MIHGTDIPDDAIAEGADIRDTRDAILLSPAMVLAYHAEAHAPPFGIFVDDSAKTFPQLTDADDTGFISNLYQWWRDDEEATAVALLLYEQIKFYMDKAKVHSVGMGYPLERILQHETLATEYFGGLSRETEAQPPPGN